MQRSPDTPLRLAIDATCIPLRHTGIGVYVANLICALARLDHHNHYFVFAHPGQTFLTQLGAPNFHLVPIRLPRPLRLLWEQAVLPFHVNRLQVDVLHSPHYTMPALKRCKSVVTLPDATFLLFPQHHQLAKRFFFPAMMRQSVRRADKLIAISESTRQDMIRLLGVPPAKIVAVPLAANPTFQPLSPSQVEEACRRHNLYPGKYILFVGVLEPRKNVSVLIHAFARLAESFPDLHLVLVGKPGWMCADLSPLVADLGLAARVRFVGYVPESDLPALYNGARVFVYPSLYEGFGLPVLEALQCGTPVVTSNVSSMPEVAGDAALLVAPGDVEALAGALRRILTDDVLAGDLRRRGLARAPLFSWDRCAAETLAVYQSCCTPT